MNIGQYVGELGLALAMVVQPLAVQDVPVDLELVLAVDVSQSVDGYEGQLQRMGYVRALSDERVIDVILSAPFGRVAVTFLEWAGPGLWRPVADWHIIDSAGAAREFAEILARVPVARGQGTSITSVIHHAMGLFDDNGAEGVRRVIDISGDGPNNRGGIVSDARDAAVAAGITVNGVAINNFDGSAFTLPDLDVYYYECVIGGPGAFVLAADGFESFADAIRRKLILEIAGRIPAVILAGAEQSRLAQAEGGPKYAPACDIGEQMRFFNNPRALP